MKSTRYNLGFKTEPCSIMFMNACILEYKNTKYGKKIYQLKQCYLWVYKGENRIRRELQKRHKVCCVLLLFKNGNTHENMFEIIREMQIETTTRYHLTHIG